MIMVDQTPMILLAVVLILAIGITGFLILHRWKTSRIPKPQDPPEVVDERWLRREAENAARHRL
jgi:hypothetical protein